MEEMVTHALTLLFTLRVRQIRRVERLQNSIKGLYLELSNVGQGTSGRSFTAASMNATSSIVNAVVRSASEIVPVVSSFLQNI